MIRKLLGVVLAVLATSACSSTTSPSNLAGAPSTNGGGGGTGSGGSTFRSSSVLSTVDATHNCNPPSSGNVGFSPTEFGKVSVTNGSTCTNDFSLVVLDAADPDNQKPVAMFSLTLAPGATGILTVGLHPEQCSRTYQRIVLFGILAKPGQTPSDWNNVKPVYAPGALWKEPLCVPPPPLSQPPPPPPPPPPPTFIHQSQMRIVSATTDLADAPSILDGNPDTRWVTIEFPQEVVINLGGSYSVSGVNYTSNTWTPVDGYEIYVSSDGSNWGTSVASGLMPASGVITFAGKTGSYLKFRALSGGYGRDYAYVAELNVSGS